MLQDYEECFPPDEPHHQDGHTGRNTTLSPITEMSETTTARSISVRRSSVRFSLPPVSSHASAANNIYRASTSTMSPFADSTEFSDEQLTDPFSDANSVASSKTSAPSEHSSDTVSTRIHFSSEAAQSVAGSNRNSAYSAGSGGFTSTDSVSESLRFAELASRSSTMSSRYNPRSSSGPEPSTDQERDLKSSFIPVTQARLRRLLDEVRGN
ncbi:hypothetical protein CONPUDRAFT_143665 [Coniophora puteana RWD-64-598 SS2]|uniref:Uncharacterized protein n=1 Tax=Coniophora puteana (strain RWD-64-598) TaxID=741705 RepID=A0A5M3MT18_CONPW|nr:uncharacterized protein CONPUDRAFT_143665 [Coniophora puteana RWD-64-598 SS2]EIW82187.1 hypothetical protein CONPUDRAFT_143665 [Coniophora puteana RWD-64-598 SS2]